MPLTDTAIKSAKPEAKQIKLYDGNGLLLIVSPAGGKWWRLKYRSGGKEKMLSIGTYPEVSLKDARDKAAELRKLIRDGIDPGEKRKATKQAATEERQRQEATFEAVALEWMEKQKGKWTPAHLDRVRRRMKKNLFPWIGKAPVSEITPSALLDAIRRVEGRGVVETAHRALQNARQVFTYAIVTGRAERNPASDLKGALSAVKSKHFATITDPEEIARLLQAINDYKGGFATRCALKLSPLVFVRPGELRKAEWAEINLEKKEWRIPAEKMKMRDPHIVPLSSQAIKVIKELQPLTGAGKYLFPSERTKERPMSENTITAALRRMGYAKEEMTAHGFRAMASTLLHEHGFVSDIIERQLAHIERNAVKAAYNHAQHLKERREMMQWWGDYLEKLEGGEG